ncbi:hypothetical protein ABFS82_13G147000 [Erythranthe guttata]
MYTSILLAMVVMHLTLFLCYGKIFHARKEKRTPTNWPVLGMLPGALANIGRPHEYITEVLQQNGGTFYHKGPWFTNLNIMFTCDPVNVHYIQAKNFSNFQKGPEFKKMFDIMGEGILTAESESWENQRRSAKSLINNTSFLEFVATTTSNKMETALIPILEVASETGLEVDMQELFERLTFDSSCILVLGHDPVSLCKELPYLPHEKAFVDAEEAIFYRHVLPEFTWKLQSWLRIGKENKMSKAKEIIPRFLSYCISAKHQKHGNNDINGLNMLTSYNNRALAEKGALNEPNNINISDDEKVWKDTLLNLMFAGKGTISAALTWLFWLLATNPEEEEKIRQEMLTNLHVDKSSSKWKFEDLKKLNYLHGAVCETLRLYPTIAFQFKSTVEHDILPSGHAINANTKTVLSLYSMGRMESIWGKDCLNFKPGRWINPETGRIKTEPSFKFSAFNSGPRSCLGKEITFIQMKIVAAAIMSRFHFRVAQGHLISPSASVVLHMKHGLKVKVSDYA